MALKENYRELLIDAVVRVAAREGLDRTTTKLIAAEVPCNEVYIYRNFGSKDALLQARLSRYFISSHDSWLLMAHIFETILSFVSHVLCGDLQDTPELDEQVFSLIFRTLQPYMLP